MRDIKRRRTSVQSTQQITKAMKLVSTVKLQKARTRAEESKPYFDCMYATMTSLLAKAGNINHPYLKADDSKKKAVIVVTSNRGLAGGLPHGTSLALQGVPVDMDTDPEWLAQYMTDFGFDRALYTYEAEGFAPYRERYKALCVNLGRRVTYDGGAGTAVDVDDEGRLIVRDETGDTRVFTGEVSVKGIYGAV